MHNFPDVKKRILTFLFSKLLPLICFSQVSDPESILLEKLDSIHHSNSVARHFARLYLATTHNATDFFQTADEPVKYFIQRLETKFATYFFESATAYQHNDSISSNWITYYADTTLSPIQYDMLGANAHINGDIWKALTTEFTFEELKKYKQYYFNYEKELKKIYFSEYENALAQSSQIKLLHTISFGADKCYGRMMLSRWRNRQMKIAILYFTDKKKFDRELKKLNRKMVHINNLVLRHL
jgi:hypothetical protein